MLDHAAAIHKNHKNGELSSSDFGKIKFNLLEKIFPIWKVSGYLNGYENPGWFRNRKRQRHSVIVPSGGLRFVASQSCRRGSPNREGASRAYGGFISETYF
jgi:hypothetical protein